MDVFDIQAEHSLPGMLQMLHSGLPSALETYSQFKTTEPLAREAIAQLEKFDFENKIESIGATIFANWELQIKGNIHG